MNQQSSHEPVDDDASSLILHMLVLYLQVPNNWQLAVDALQHGAWRARHDTQPRDLEFTYRQDAALALGMLMRGTRDKTTLRILDAFFEDNSVSSEVIHASENIYFGGLCLDRRDTKSYGEIIAYLRS